MKFCEIGGVFPILKDPRSFTTAGGAFPNVLVRSPIKKNKKKFVVKMENLDPKPSRGTAKRKKKEEGEVEEEVVDV